MSEVETFSPKTGKDFHFPYDTPYSIQLDMMLHLFSSLSNSQVTIVESPTGTGKSLSLISASLTWLRAARLQKREQVIREVRDEVERSLVDEPAWVAEQEVERRMKKLERDENELEARLEEIRKKERERQSNAVGPARKKAKLVHNTEGSKPNDYDEFAPEPYDSDDEAHANRVPDDGLDNLTPAAREALKRLAGGTTGPSREPEEPDIQKIFYASRTHSQLSQFVSEIRKTSFANPGADSLEIPRPIRVIPLGSRQNLCINDEVKTKSGGSNDALGDMCLELQKGGKEKRCQFLPPREEPMRLNTFRDRALASVHDIEDIEDLGRKLKTCPYYGTRRAMRSAEVVTLPYNLLVTKPAREALGISLKDNVVVIDEAHNLIQTLLDLHAVTVSLSMLKSLRSALVTYYTKFKNRFSGANATHLKQLLVVLKSLSEFAESWAKEGKKEAMLSVNQVVGALKGAMDQVNMLKLDKYLTESRLARKIGGYLDCLAEEKTAKGRQALKSTAAMNLHRLQTFLVSLNNAQRDGRVLLNLEKVIPPPLAASGQPSAPEQVEVTLKYMLLAPADSFKEVAEEAKAIILAGGTMSPMSDFREQLFPYLTPERFSTFSCGHIVSPDRVKTIAVAAGPSGMKLNFTFEKRKDEKLIDEMGLSILNICSVVPKGTVVFVPSKDFLAEVQTRWEKSGFLARLSKKKKVFWEPKDRVDVESTLRDYALANGPTETGGLLLAVVDAKLSEGINFQDDLARCVIIAGIPYPSRHSTEIKERMNYLNSLRRKVAAPGGKDPGQVLYQNMAFRGVNQSIGRAIRHINDWAAIVLLDERYQQASNQAQLPRWLGSEVKNPASFGNVMKELSQHCSRLVKEYGSV